MVVTITGNGIKTITAKAVVPTTKAGTAAETSVPGHHGPAEEHPGEDRLVTPVPGEKDATNNKQTYDALFE